VDETSRFEPTNSTPAASSFTAELLSVILVLLGWKLWSK
jgi:hypothetical protein